jgi:hypothetical protein
MFTPIYFVGLIALFAGLFGSRFLVERANKFLSPEEKLMLMDSFSSIRTYGALPLMLVVFFFLGMGYLAPEWRWPAYFIGFIGLLGYFAIMHTVISRRLRRLGINEQYRAAYNRARWVSYSGFLLFFVLNTVGPMLVR